MALPHQPDQEPITSHLCTVQRYSPYYNNNNTDDEDEDGGDSTEHIPFSMFDEDEQEEDETDWRSSLADSSLASPDAAMSGSHPCKSPPAHRVILHFDLDCFYAQVEMIRNPKLRDVPLGIQQKYIIVTCNYVARELGVSKLMSVKDAKERCPQLVLVKGEDLTHYREMSYKVTELLMSICPLVERLGFDENYMDITEMVERRLARTSESDFSFKGHVYNSLRADAKASDHQRLALGSHIAAEVREAIHTKLGLTGCAGIATNKLLAKIVSGTFKPNQQTTLLPEDVSDIMGLLSSLRKVPGVGHQTAKRLHALGLTSVKDLQLFPLADLVREFGAPSGQRLKNLSLGIDDSPVTPTGAPQSLSDEDSFKKMSSTEDVMEKMKELLSNLVERMHRDGRQPQTLRLTIRRFSATNKWFSRESRQCPIPNQIGQKITSGVSASRDDAVVHLVQLAVKLFRKMVDTHAAFHLTLINVCFSNLQAREGKGSIASFFSHSTSPGKTRTLSSQDQDSAQSGENTCTDHQVDSYDSTAGNPSSSEAALHGWKRKLSSPLPLECPQLKRGSRSSVSSPPLPSNVDPEVFKLLPEEIQKELLSLADVEPLPHTPRVTPSLSSPAAAVDAGVAAGPAPRLHSSLVSQTLMDRDGADKKWDGTSVDPQRPPGAHAAVEGGGSCPRSSDCQFPGNVDPTVFHELPPDVQRELMNEWRQQKRPLKTPPPSKPGRGSVSKDRKAAGRSSQVNNLFNYFKPT